MAEVAPVPGDSRSNSTSITDTIEEQGQQYVPGEIAPAIVTSSYAWKPGDSELPPGLIGKLTTIFENCGEADQAARRVHVLQVWESRHMDRGYQYLDSDVKGGWKIVGNTNGNNANPQKEQNDANLYPTNILAAQGDIVTGALCRGTIKVNIVPVKSKEPLDAVAAAEANKYAKLWADVNDLSTLQRDMFQTSWTDNRVLTWTRTVADAHFGFNADGSPRRREITSVHGVLESKLPMMPDKLTGCGYAIVFEEINYAVARAMYPWMGDKIKPAWGAGGEMEFERIARINTRIGITGKYLTGTSGIQETSMAYCWLRPGMYFDDMFNDDERNWMMRNLKSGVMVTFAGREICCFWEESMDDHLALGMTTRGFGQNRRSLGESDVSVQKRLNIWIDLLDKYYRKAIPATVLHDQVFDAEAITQHEADPGRVLVATPQEGTTLQQAIAQLPQAQPIPGMDSMIQYYVGPMIQAIDGGVPALFGEAEGADNTVGATAIRVQQSLERHGNAFAVGAWVLRQAACQAARLCAENGTEEVAGYIDGEGDISVDPDKLRGNFTVKAEGIVAIPESGAQRESKIVSLLDFANVNPQAAQLIASPSNAREIVRGLHLDDVITIDEADSEDKQIEEIEQLLDGVPLINPDWDALDQQIQQMVPLHESAKNAALEKTRQGTPPSPDAIEQGTQIEEQIASLQQQLTAMSKYQPSVPVAQDESEDHDTEAATMFAWMQSPEGRSIRAKARREPPQADPSTSPNWCKWTNCYLHWQGHREMQSKVARNNVQPVQPRVSISIPVDKMPGTAAVSALQKAGIAATPDDFGNGHEQETETIQRTPFAEVKQKVRRRL